MLCVAPVAGLRHGAHDRKLAGAGANKFGELFSATSALEMVNHERVCDATRACVRARALECLDSSQEHKSAAAAAVSEVV